MTLTAIALATLAMVSRQEPTNAATYIACDIAQTYSHRGYRDQESQETRRYRISGADVMILRGSEWRPLEGSGRSARVSVSSTRIEYTRESGTGTLRTERWSIDRLNGRFEGSVEQGAAAYTNIGTCRRIEDPLTSAIF